MSTHALSHKESIPTATPFFLFSKPDLIQTDLTKDRTLQLSIKSHNIQRTSSKPKFSFVNFGEKKKNLF